MSSPANTTSKQDTGVIAIVSLGSNLASSKGDSSAIVRAALVDLQALSDAPLITSSLYRSVALDSPPDAPDFINAIAILRVRAGLSATALLQRLQEIETSNGRQRGAVLNAPRTLDLDLISFGELQCRTANLTLPHPRARQRRFVMEPLAEVACDYILPGQTLTAQQCLQSLGADQVLSKLAL